MLKLCERFHALPSQIDQEDIRITQLVATVALGNPEGEESPDEFG